MRFSSSSTELAQQPRVATASRRIHESQEAPPSLLHRIARAWVVLRWKLAANVFAISLPYLTAEWDIKVGDLLLTLPFMVLMLAGNVVVALSSQNVSGSGILPEFGMVFVFWLAVRNNSVLLSVTGLSFERALFYHKAMALVTLALTMLHMAAYMTTKSDDKEFSTTKVLSGGASFFAMLILVLFAINRMRRNYFELFVKIHWVLFVVAIVAAVVHGAFGVLLGALPWLIDVIFRYVYRPRIYSSGGFKKSGDPFRLGVIAREQVMMQRLPAGVTLIKFPRVRAITGEEFKYSAGQYAFLHVPELGGKLEWHPFTISSAPHEDMVTFHVRSLGDWTHKLAAQIPAEGDNNAVLAPFDIFVDGPYGQVSVDLEGHLPETRYSHIVMFCGGIGITPMRSLINQLHHEFQHRGNIDGKLPHLKSVRLIWSVKDFDVVDAFFQPASEQVSHSYIPDFVLAESNESFRAEIFVTRPTEERDVEAQQRQQLATIMKLKQRPDIVEILRETGELAAAEQDENHRVAVLVCGPEPMVKSVINESIALTREMKPLQFDVHHEYFSF